MALVDAHLASTNRCITTDQREALEQTLATTQPSVLYMHDLLNEVCTNM